MAKERRNDEPGFTEWKAGIVARLTEKIVRSETNEDTCWTWTGATHHFGYGLMKAPCNLRRQGGPSKLWPAHRLAYALLVGRIPTGLLVLHRCDNPPCCNPRHLFLGTHRDNTQDMMQKGRDRFGGDHPPATRRLTMNEAREIRRLVASGMQQKEAATLFGLSRMGISLLVRGKTYKDVGSLEAGEGD